MSTHGRILVKDESDELTLYAWSNGHTKTILFDLIKLPYTIFYNSRERYRNKAHLGSNFYEIILTAAKENKWDKAEFESVWDSMNLIEIDLVVFASWISYLHFNRWMVVPNLDYCSYPGDKPDLTIDVYDGSYNILIRDEFNEFIKDVQSLIVADEHISLDGNMCIVDMHKILIDLMWEDIKCM